MKLVKDSRTIVLASIIFLVIFGCNQSKEVSPPYATTEKLQTPIVLEEGKITTVNGISFSKNGMLLYTSGNLDKTFDNGRNYAGIFQSEYKNGQWTPSEYLDIGDGMDAYHPVLSKDNTQLFFNSRSHPDSANTAVKHNIWVATRINQGWSAPEIVKNINSNSYDSYPSVANSGNLYFNSDRDGGKGGMDFYVSYLDDGRYSKPINLDLLNSQDAENDLVVDPQERFIIFNRYLFDSRDIDLYISFNQQGGWTTPRKLDNINTDKWELTPTLSPDGNYFFFELDSQIMQVDLAVLIYEDELPGVGRRKRD